MDWRRQLKEYAYFCKLITQILEQKGNSNENYNNENIPTVDGGSHLDDNQLDSPDVV
jgi:hypothetical protein